MKKEEAEKSFLFFFACIHPVLMLKNAGENIRIG